jgi:hypothetical protein
MNRPRLPKAPKRHDTPPLDGISMVGQRRGRQQATDIQAADLRDNIFPSVLSVQFVHTSPLHLAWISQTPSVYGAV